MADECSRERTILTSPRLRGGEQTEAERCRLSNPWRVIGAGAWGTALAGVAARAGREVVLYARSPESAAQIAATRANPKLSGAPLAASINVTSDIASAARADIMLIATPAQHLRAAVTALAPHLAPATPLIACAKGIERGTHKFMTEVIAEAAPDAIAAILSGPSFADDVARGLPTAVTLAARDEAARQRAGAGAGICDLPALSHHGRARRRDRRRREERARDRGRHRGRPKARRVGAGGADHARLYRVGAARARLRRAQRNHGGAFGPGRPDPDLLQPAVAQFRARRSARARRAAAAWTNSPRANSPRRC